MKMKEVFVLTGDGLLEVFDTFSTAFTYLETCCGLDKRGQLKQRGKNEWHGELVGTTLSNGKFTLIKMKVKTNNDFYPYQTSNAEVGDVIKIDKSESEYVVEKTEFSGGGCGHGPGDVYPDGWHVTARKLNPNGSYDAKGKVKSFYQTGCFSNMIEKVQVVRKLKKNVNFS